MPRIAIALACAVLLSSCGTASYPTSGSADPTEAAGPPRNPFIERTIERARP